MKKSEALKKLREEVIPVIDPAENNQPCRTCPYWNKECAIDLDILYIAKGHAILICVMKVRDYIKRKNKNKNRKK